MSVVISQQTLIILQFSIKLEFSLLALGHLEAQLQKPDLYAAV